jgi:hypothetical protein
MKGKSNKGSTRTSPSVVTDINKALVFLIPWLYWKKMMYQVSDN